MNYKIIGKYIRDLKFEIPNSTTFFLLEKNIANYKINIDIKSNTLKNRIIEVVITLSLDPDSQEIESINTKIVFSGEEKGTSIVIDPSISFNKLNWTPSISIEEGIGSMINESTNLR